MSEHVPTETPPTAALRLQGLLAVAVLIGIVVVIMLVMAFSTKNTPQSIDGDRATYSGQLDSDE